MYAISECPRNQKSFPGSRRKWNTPKKSLKLAISVSKNIGHCMGHVRYLRAISLRRFVVGVGMQPNDRQLSRRCRLFLTRVNARYEDCRNDAFWAKILSR